jgi:hypothetical protein
MSNKLEVKRLRALGVKALGRFVDEELNPIELTLHSTDENSIIKEARLAIKHMENSRGYKKGYAKLKELDLLDDENWYQYKLKKSIAAKELEKNSLILLPPIQTLEQPPLDGINLETTSTRQSSTNSIDEILARISTTAKTSSQSRTRSYLKKELATSIMTRRAAMEAMVFPRSRKVSSGVDPEDDEPYQPPPTNFRMSRRLSIRRAPPAPVSVKGTSVFLTETSIQEDGVKITLKSLMSKIIIAHRFIRTYLSCIKLRNA